MRAKRIESSTQFYHVMVKGNNQKWIFKDNHKKRMFLNLMKEAVVEEGFNIVAWCIMDNHVHLVARAEYEQLTKVIGMINTKFAIRYNLSEKHSGHVFQDRFKSQPIETDEYLLQVIRYIHHNPVKANIVGECNEYKWSSFNQYMNPEEEQLNLDSSDVLQYFEGDKEKLLRFHQEYDYHEYLDTKEDVERHRMKKAEWVINHMAEKYGMTDQYEFYRNQDVMNELLENMITKSGMSLRAIANHVGVTFHRVQKVNVSIKRDGGL